MRMLFSTIVAISLTAALAGCAGSSGSRDQSKPDIGAAPAYAGEVRVPAAQPNENPILVAERERLGRIKANKIIRCLVADRAATRATFLGLGTDDQAASNCAKPADAVAGRRKKAKG